MDCQVTAFQLLIWLRNQTHLPRPRGLAMTQPLSNSELRRWLDKGSVWINGTAPKPNDLIDMGTNMGVRQLVFFPGSVSQCTLVWDDSPFPENWLKIFFGTHPKQLAATIKKTAENQKSC